MAYPTIQADVVEEMAFRNFFKERGTALCKRIDAEQIFDAEGSLRKGL